MKRHKNVIFVISFIAFLVILLPYLLNYIFPHINLTFFNPSPTKTTPEIITADEFDAWFYFLSGLGTAYLAFIAWLKAGEFHKQNEGDILLHIDGRWGSKQSIRAHVIIHKLYLQVQKDNANVLI